MRRVLARLEGQASGLRAAVAERFPSDPLLGAMITEWVGHAREAVEREAAFREASLGEWVPGIARAETYLASNSRSFRFASRFFRPGDAERVARVYAYCRITDDLVDRPPEGSRAEELLETWLELSRRAYRGESTRSPLLDQVMGEMAAAGVPFDYAAELAEGMRMDLRAERYASLAELRRYTYRVAAVVGLWLTRLFGVHDPALLERAERMGHAMQLTNILRDVGEDWGFGRLYLPLDLMQRHGVEEVELARMCAGGQPTCGYCALIEELIGVAEADYRAALAALPSLPSSFARPVAVAAHVYRGIHREIRRRGYDNLRQRAYTGPLAKGRLAARALWELHRAPRTVGGEAIAAAREETPLAPAADE
jgi:phytoene synthase